MGKTVIVTAGPTNERIDAVMKITNMSTGALSCRIAEQLLSDKSVSRVYYISPKLAYKPNYPEADVEDDGRLCRVQVESTNDLLNVLRILLTNKAWPVDAVIHAAAVGDYKGRYVARAEDIAHEIAVKQKHGVLSTTDILNILRNPDCLQNDSTKISSYEPNLMVMLDLTPKVIGAIKHFSPNTMLIGCKLLENVSEQELFNVASRLRKHNNADYIIANDLKNIGGGKHPAIIIGANPDGSESDMIIARCQTKTEIAEQVKTLVLNSQ